jgi:glycosyltransferase involved in cell wall biosynthesis
MSLEILQIVPRFPPSISGVGDYVCLLARQLRAAHGIHTRFLVCDPCWSEKSEIEGFSVVPFDIQKAGELTRRMSGPEMPETALLHYVGYGYHKRGCPLWLVRGLKSWKKANATHRLLVMFHELYAFGPPWSSSFWTSPVQRALVKSLALMSDHNITNLEVSRKSLARITSRSENGFSVLPVFSNVGEPHALPDWGNRRPRLVVFGDPAWRKRAYVEHHAALEDTCAAFGLDEIVDIGSPCGALPKLRVPCVLKGNLPAQQVSEELLNARAGFFAYPAAYLGKSGILAAYAAHGLAPVTHAKNIADNYDGLRERDHFVSIGSWYSYGVGDLQRVGQAAREWYASHKISAQAGCYAEIFQLMHRERGHADALLRPVYATEKLTA